jgi:hypothetical protein
MNLRMRGRSSWINRNPWPRRNSLLPYLFPQSRPLIRNSHLRVNLPKWFQNQNPKRNSLELLYQRIVAMKRKKSNHQKPCLLMTKFKIKRINLL